MKHTILKTLAAWLLTAWTLQGCNSQEQQSWREQEKPRIVVLTDIAPGDIEPDDMESMIRLLVHADLFEIEALVASSGWNNSGRAYPIEWMDSLRICLDAYEKDLPNLMKRSEQTAFLPLEAESKSQKIGYWPSAEYLRSRTMLGSREIGFEHIGEGNDSEGSNFIIRLLQEDDKRPLWVLAWGGANALTQAVWRMKQQYDEEKWRSMLEKLRLYTITDQDQDIHTGKRDQHLFSSHHWLRKVCGKSLRFIWDESAWGTQNEIGSKNWNEYARHIQKHGHLGNIYPKYKWGVEGDTPSFLHVMPTGLNDPEVFDHVGWGGFFKWGITKDEETCCYTNIDPAVRAISRKYEEYFYPAVFHNFAARMDWAKEGRGNRNPVVRIGKDETLQVIRLSAKKGKEVVLDATGSYDPDGDNLQYRWWVLPEAGTFRGEMCMENPKQASVSLFIPEEAETGESIHVICEVTDNGTPALTAYRRVIIDIR